MNDLSLIESRLTTLESRIMRMPAGAALLSGEAARGRWVAPDAGKDAIPWYDDSADAGEQVGWISADAGSTKKVLAGYNNAFALELVNEVPLGGSQYDLLSHNGITQAWYTPTKGVLVKTAGGWVNKDSSELKYFLWCGYTGDAAFAQVDITDLAATKADGNYSITVASNQVGGLASISEVPGGGSQYDLLSNDGAAAEWYTPTKGVLIKTGAGGWSNVDSSDAKKYLWSGYEGDAEYKQVAITELSGTATDGVYGVTVTSNNITALTKLTMSHIDVATLWSGRHGSGAVQALCYNGSDWGFYDYY